MSGGSDSNLNSQVENSPVEEICQVCTDKSTGYHYGTPSCNGCKTFFRRTIMKKQTFVCQYDGNCIIDKSVRCACRHCRFKKCLAVGMNREAIQQNRDPIGYTKRTRRYPPIKGNSGGGGSGISLPSNSSSIGSRLGEGGSPQDSLNESSPEQIAEEMMMQEIVDVEKNLKTVRSSQISIQKSLVDIVLQPSIFFDQDFLRKQSETPSHTIEVLRRATQADFHYWHERDWVIMIEWAKTIGVYERLPLSDKLALLRHSAITYPSLIQCFYTPDLGPDTIVFPNGAYFDRTLEPDRPAGFQRKKFKMLDNLLNPIRKMNIDISEFAVAKAIFFLNPDADDLSAEVRSQIADGRSALTNALYRYMVKRRGSEEAADRFGKLLLLGTVIATIAVEAKEAVVVADFFEQIYFSSFAKQLLFGLKAGDESPIDVANITIPDLTGVSMSASSSQMGAAPIAPLIKGMSPPGNM